MKSLSLIVCLILTVGYLTSVTAVTDAELEALEKQIEQQEVEENQKAEAEAKRKAVLEKQRLEKAKRVAEEKRKAEAQRQEEAKRVAEEKRKEEEAQKQEEELKILAEQKRIEEEKRKAAEARLAELERQRQEEAKKRAEEEKKEKYNLLLSKGRDLALITEGAKLSTPVGDTPQGTKDAAIDGITNNYGIFDGYSHSQWNIPGSYIFVTLKEVSFVNKLRFLLWDRDNRYYQYRLEVSRDQQDWEVISDKSSGKWRSWQEFVFEPKEIKYIKIVGLYNSNKIFFSDNVWFHVVELEAFGLPLSEMK